MKNLKHIFLIGSLVLSKIINAQAGSGIEISEEGYEKDSLLSVIMKDSLFI